jgi:alpha-1,2-mannosyltransferase
LIAVVEMLWLTWSGIRHGIWVDTDVYAMGGRTVRDGGDLYTTSSAEDLPFTYSPFAAAMFVPFSMLQVDVGRILFTVVSLACYALVVTIVSRRLRFRWWQILVLGGVGLAFEPMLRNLILGQVNLVLMALVVTDWLLLPPRYRGYVTGIAAGIKITPAAFVVLAILRRDWAVAARAGVGFFGSVAVGWLVAPDASRIFWSGGFMGLEKFGGAAVIGSDNQSLLGAWMRVTGTLSPSQAVQLATLVAGMSLGVVAAVLELRRASRHSEVAALAWVALGSLLGSPVSWSHHWVWLVLPLAVLLARRQYIAFSATAAIVWYPTIWALAIPGHFRELSFSPGEKIISCAYVIIGIALMTSVLFTSVRSRLSDGVTPTRAPTEHAEDLAPSSTA